MKYILASASPRRKELLSLAGFDFEVIPSGIEEKITKTIPSEVVIELALQKAEDVYLCHTENNCTIIGADTVVAYRDQILGKPKDENDAFDMLSMLSDQHAPGIYRSCPDYHRKRHKAHPYLCGSY